LILDNPLFIFNERRSSVLLRDRQALLSINRTIFFERTLAA
jgi:hypothetical protein